MADRRRAGREKKTRINLNTMSTIDIVVAMSDGLIGVIVICMELVKNEKRVDPDSFWGDIGIGSILTLDMLGIYGERIGRLSDLCQNDAGKMIAVLRAYQLGQLAGVDKRTLDYAIDGFGGEINVDAAVKAVKARLPRFNPESLASSVNASPISTKVQLENLWGRVVEMVSRWRIQ